MATSFGECADEMYRALFPRLLIHPVSICGPLFHRSRIHSDQNLNLSIFTHVSHQNFQLSKTDGIKLQISELYDKKRIFESHMPSSSDSCQVSETIEKASAKTRVAVMSIHRRHTCLGECT
jgi:hypothetical protein